VTTTGEWAGKLIKLGHEPGLVTWNLAMGHIIEEIQTDSERKGAGEMRDRCIQACATTGLSLAGNYIAEEILALPLPGDEQ